MVGHRVLVGGLPGSTHYDGGMEKFGVGYVLIQTKK